MTVVGEVSLFVVVFVLVLVLLFVLLLLLLLVLVLVLVSVLLFLLVFVLSFVLARGLWVLLVLAASAVVFAVAFLAVLPATVAFAGVSETRVGVGVSARGAATPLIDLSNC